MLFSTKKTGEVVYKTPEVAKPNFRFGYIQEFCDNYKFIS